MSDYHILEQDREQKGYTIAYHFPAAAGNNSAGRLWSDCLKEYKTRGGGSLVSQVPNIDAGEQTSINNGTVIEVVQFFRFSRVGLTAAQKKAEIDAGNGGSEGKSWAAIKAEKAAELALVLENWTRAFNLS